MTNIIQDFRNWKNIRKDLQQTKESAVRSEEHLIHFCDKHTWNRNIKNEQMFNECIPLPKDIDGLCDMAINVHKNIQIINKAAQKYRATSCFYKYKNEIRQCINFSSNDSLKSDVRCNTCPQFMFLKYLQRLNYDIEKKEKQYEIAKQKLLDNFRFWKIK